MTVCSPKSSYTNIASREPGLPASGPCNQDLLAYAADLIAELRQLTAPAGNPRLDDMLAEAEREARRTMTAS